MVWIVNCQGLSNVSKTFISVIFFLVNPFYINGARVISLISLRISKQELKNNPHLTLKEYDESKPKRGMGSGWWILIGADFG